MLAAALAACGGQAPPDVKQPTAQAQNDKPAAVNLNSPETGAPAKGAAERIAGGPGGGDDSASDGNWSGARGQGADTTIAAEGAEDPAAGAPADARRDMGAAPENRQIAAGAPKIIPGSNPVSVSANDPALGKATALVTIVEFGDFQCPFCRKSAGTITDLRKQYGDQLRFVWKNNPLPFHKEARPAAETAAALFQKGGNGAFWSFYDAVYSSTGSLTPDVYENAVKNAQVPRGELERILQSGSPARKIDDDIALAKQIGADATPIFYINGVMLRGAQSIDKFREIIDREIPKAKELLASGIPQNQVYDVAARKNFVFPAPKAASAPAANPADDKTTHFVPLDNSPVKGKNSALVTLVVFSDFQCPFCVRVKPTLDQLEKNYGDKLRIVFKNNPLSFHPRAEPAAQLALEALAQKGAAGFWKVHDALFASEGKLETSDLERIAKESGLNAKTAMAAVASHKHRQRIEADQDLADDLEANGTPSFFINGRRLTGARPIDQFEAIINEELSRADDLVKKGTPATKVYETLQKQAIAPKAPPTVTIGAPGKDSPSKGPDNAKVTIQVFSDFQCPFCKKVEPTLAKILETYPKDVRIVWRNMPLTSIHPQADLAAEAAMEVFRQKGSTGFWQMHDKLFEGQQNNGLERAQLETYAQGLGIDMTKLKNALDTGAHKPIIERDKKLAETAKITGTPAFVINGYLISGAQPFGKFRRTINLAIKESQGVRGK